MSLIKIFPTFSPVTEKNIQATKVGEIFGANLFLHESKNDAYIYLEIPMAGGNLYERVYSTRNSPLDINKGIFNFKNKFEAHFSDLQSVKDQQYNFYGDLFQKMFDGELAPNRHHLVSYTKYKIIFGAMALSEEQFNGVLLKLKEKQLAKNAEDEIERIKKNEIAELARREAAIKYQNEVKSKILNNEFISGGELVDFCKDYGINIPIRTQGAFNKNVVKVNSLSGTSRGGTSFKISPMSYYEQLYKILLAEKQPV